MRAKKTILCLWAGILMLLTAVQPVTALAKTTFKDNADFLQDYESNDNRLVVYMHNLTGGELTADQIYAELGDVPLNVTGISKASELPVTYYCLVDVSGSVSNEQYKMETTVLRKILDGMRDGDQMVIATIGDKIVASEYMTDKGEIAKAIDAIVITHEDTNLYKAIADGIRNLNSSDEANKRKCLVVISDGKDEQQNGQTKRDADRLITDSRIPVYTVALNTDQDMYSEWTEYAKLLGSFARESAGGEHFSMSDQKPEDAGAGIVSGMGNHIALTLELSDTLPKKEELLLEVTVKGNGSETYGDAMKVYSRNLEIKQSPATEEDPATTQDSATTQDAATTQDPATTQDEATTQDPATTQDAVITQEPTGPVEPDNPINIWWVVGAVVLILAALCAFLLTRKKKEDEGEENTDNSDNGETENASANADVITEEPSSETQNVTEYNAFSSAGPIPETEMNEAPLRKIILKAIGNSDFEASFEINEGVELTIGRDPSADLVLNTEDRKLSRINSRILLKDNLIKVWDAESRNGTFVNGVPIEKGKAAYLKDRDTLRIGSLEYRVHIEDVVNE